MGQVMPAPLELEYGDQVMVDDLIEVNLGIEKDPWSTFISFHLFAEEHAHYLKFLKEN